MSEQQSEITPGAPSVERVAAVDLRPADAPALPSAPSIQIARKHPLAIISGRTTAGPTRATTGSEGFDW